jgi:transcriptional regulator of arginine metabolism
MINCSPLIVKFRGPQQSFAAFFDGEHNFSLQKMKGSGPASKAILNVSAQMQPALLAMWKAREIFKKSSLHSYTVSLYIYASAAPYGAALISLLRIVNGSERAKLKTQRHSAIREVVASSPVTNQDELRRKLRRLGFAVTQATLSRDIHELHIYKGPAGYALPNGNGNGNGQGAAAEEELDDSPPSVKEVIDSFGLKAVQAMNQVIIHTVMGGAQPVAAALDYEEWPEVAGTIAGDDTVLVICRDTRRASEVEARLRVMLES